ncbi:hypothetical protein PBAC_00170 [Pedobacter glucosidilyticus]|nr:hypothetical protein [Pedobacter glucosidilyticus]KHJ39510.1 hypothetical protein PBAC_00170 [Pedobacter glucosidilyticus]
MKHFTLFTLLTLAIFALNSCKKDPTKNAVLPAATQEGKNTVGFTLNDEVWVPYAKCGLWLSQPCRKIAASYGGTNAKNINYPVEKGGLALYFSREIEKDGKKSFLSISTFRTTITSIGEKIDSIDVFFSGDKVNGTNTTYSRILDGSRFVITKIDTNKEVISGQFELILSENQNGTGKQIILKNGRFDLKMNACLCD